MSWKEHVSVKSLDLMGNDRLEGWQLSFLLAMQRLQHAGRRKEKNVTQFQQCWKKWKDPEEWDKWMKEAFTNVSLHEYEAEQLKQQNTVEFTHNQWARHFILGALMTLGPY